MFEEFIGYSILGLKYVLQTTDIDKIVGPFSMINNKLLVILDETKGKDTFLNDEKIKNLITTTKIAWERKGIDGCTINNFARPMFFTNGDTPVPIPFNDRRFSCFNCSNKRANDRQYFKHLVKIMKDQTVIYSFHVYLKNRDISNFDIVADRPKTDFYKELQNQSVPCIARFLIHCIFDETDEANIYARDLYSKFKRWCQDTNRNVNYTDTRFGRELKKYKGIDKKRKSGGFHYSLDFNEIKHCLVDKQYLNEEECSIDCSSDKED